MMVDVRSLRRSTVAAVKFQNFVDISFKLTDSDCITSCTMTYTATSDQIDLIVVRPIRCCTLAAAASLDS